MLLIAYADTFAESWGRRVKAVLEEWGPDVFGIEVDRHPWYSRQAAGEWAIKEWGAGWCAWGSAGRRTGGAPIS